MAERRRETHVLDASAILAVLLQEPGAERVVEAGPDGIVSAVNLSEVIAKMSDRGADPEEVAHHLRGLALLVVPFDAAKAEAAAFLRARTREANVSFADRACLSLALDSGLPILTTDRAWAELDLGIDIRLIR